MPSFKPTKTCFDDVVEWITFQSHFTDQLDQYKIVHGICVLTEKECQGGPREYSHAWIERPHKNEAIDFGINTDDNEKYGILMDIDKHDEYYGMKEKTIYTIKEARVFKGSGPWKKKYLMLCGDYNPLMVCDFNEDIGKEIIL